MTFDPGDEVMNAVRGQTVKVKCQRCKQPFMARVADRKRGWGRFCSKSCKAIKQVQTHGDGRFYRPGVSWDRFRADQREHGGTPQYNDKGEYEGFTMNSAELAGGGYGDADWDTPFGDGKW